METKFEEPESTNPVSESPSQPSEPMIPIAQILQENYAAAETSATPRPYKQALKKGVLWGVITGIIVVAVFLIVSR